MDRQISRRRFVAAASASAASVMIVPRHLLGGSGVQAPSDTLNVAGIGVGGRGRADVRGCSGENVAALCDADLGFAARTFREFPRARIYQDYRQMLDREPDLDAVVIATPDHTHAVIAMEAMRRGKHVYCEKPLTRTVAEARALATAARARRPADRGRAARQPGRPQRRRHRVGRRADAGLEPARCERVPRRGVPGGLEPLTPDRNGVSRRCALPAPARMTRPFLPGPGPCRRTEPSP